MLQEWNSTFWKTFIFQMQAKARYRETSSIVETNEYRRYYLYSLLELRTSGSQCKVPVSSARSLRKASKSAPSRMRSTQRTLPRNFTPFMTPLRASGMVMRWPARTQRTCHLVNKPLLWRTAKICNCTPAALIYTNHLPTDSVVEASQPINWLLPE